MTLTLADRAKIVVRYLAKKQGVTQSKIGQMIGYNNKTAFSGVLNGLKTMPKKFGEKLAALDPEINPAFLDGSSEEMLLDTSEQPAMPEKFINQASMARPSVQTVKPGSIVIPPELAQMFTQLSTMIFSQQETIHSQQETIRLLVGDKEKSANAG